MQNDIRSEVRKFINDKFLYRDGLTSFQDDASFLGAGIIDSTGVLEVVLFLEESYGIKVADEEMVPENLDSISALTSYVQRKLHARQAQAV
jgi:acyl carrier protein